MRSPCRARCPVRGGRDCATGEAVPTAAATYRPRPACTEVPHVTGGAVNRARRRGLPLPPPGGPAACTRRPLVRLFRQLAVSVRPDVYPGPRMLAARQPKSLKELERVKGIEPSS